MTKAFIRWSWGRSELFGDLFRIDGQAPSYAAYQRITGAELAALAKPSEGGAPPILQPGDLICNGSAGETGHVVVYVGDNDKGEPQIIHAMATQYEGRSLTQRLWDVARLLCGWNPDKIGVIKEGLAEFVDRYGRDTIIILRDPRMTPPMLVKFIARVHELVGRPYDFSFNPNNDGFYCSEVAKEGYIAAYKGTGMALPWIGTSWIERGAGLVRVAQWIPQPENLAVSPDFNFVWANASGQQAYQKIRRTMVCGKPAN